MRLRVFGLISASVAIASPYSPCTFRLLHANLNSAIAYSRVPAYPNVWLGMTAEDQQHFDQRWKHLQKIPALIKFISYEPALGPLRLPTRGPFPDWLISGGESGGGARPVKRQWIQDVIADCRQHGVAPFHKQWGSYGNNPLVVNKGLSIDKAKVLDAFGKGGGLVDDELIREYPVPRHTGNRKAA